ncbi:MAG TPA: alcohol dehydrogenase catalytic domain-containing protein [Acidimicrobiales bacterium]|nr:alcohol dehydrogenase catalytic domain-containing protein [Acidimicrobiales bacterium]
MRAVVAASPDVVEVRDVAEPEVQDSGDAVVSVVASAICGADLLPVAGHVPNFEWGTVLGHEFIGTVLKIGDDVPFKVGTRVVCSSTVSCGHCRACREGGSSQCESMSLFGFSGVYPRLDGGQAERVRVPHAGRLLWPLPSELDDDNAVFVADILPTAMRAVERADFHDDDVVVIMGAGPVGLLAILLSMLKTDRVLVVEPDAARREFVTSWGAWTCVPEEAPAKVAELSGGRGADAVIEASGNEAALRLGLQLVRGRGTVSVAGAHFNPAAPIDLGGMFAKETTLRFSMGSPTDDRQRAANLILDGRINPSRIISHRFSLEDAPEAYEAFRTHQATKIVLRP